MRSRSIVLAGVLGALSLVAAVPGAGAKGATPITSCGQTVTTNAFLAQDLSCSGQSGVVVGAPNIIIDLKGHALTGDGTDYGVDDTGGFDGAKVENGVVRAFFDGVLLNADGVVVSNLVASGNSAKGIAIGGAGARVESSIADGNVGYGIDILGPSARVRSSSASGNGSAGIQILGPSAQVSSATVTGNGGGIVVAGASARVKSSTVSGNRGVGIEVNGDAARVGGNRADGNGFGSSFAALGIHVYGYTTAPVGQNLARGNADPSECSPSSLC